MKHTNKKGFTIVELVIVIAVIAILAAVLIPTFSNLIKKANISNDTAIAKNLNTAAISAQADDFGKAIEAAKESGYLVAHLKAKADNVFFVWEDDTNQFLLYDLDVKKVLYSNTTVDNTPDESWYFVVNNVKDQEGVLAAYSNVKAPFLTADANVLSEILALGGTQTVYVDESCGITEGVAFAVNAAGANITLDLGDSTLSTSGVISGAPILVANGATLTVKGGTLQADGTFKNEHGTFNCAIGYDGIEDDDPNTITTLNVEGVNFVGTTGINGTMNLDGQIVLNVTDSTFNVTSGGIILSAGNYGSTATVNNCNVVAGGRALFVSQGSTYTVNGGFYKGGIAAIGCQDSTFIVNGGTFEGAIEVTGNSTLTINGGTFTVDPTQWLGEGKTVVNNGNGTWTVQ